jgi:hypothetical protein
VGETSAKNTQNTTSAVGSPSAKLRINYGGWVKLLQRSVPIKKKENKKAICLLSSLDGSDTVFNGQRALRQSSGWRNGNQECPSLSLLVQNYFIWFCFILSLKDNCYYFIIYFMETNDFVIFLMLLDVFVMAFFLDSSFSIW